MRCKIAIFKWNLKKGGDNMAIIRLIKKVVLIPLLIMGIITVSHAPVFCKGSIEVKERLLNSIEVLQDILGIKEKGIPISLLEKCKALIIIPHMIKGGFVIGAARGKGIMIHRLPNGAWSDPAFCTITAGSIGFQIGGQATDLVLVVNSEKGFQALLSDNFKFGAGASIAAGPVGRDATASTDAKLKADIYSYSRSKGLFAGISLEGAGLTSDNDSNTDFYGKTIAREILLSRHSQPYPAPELIKLLKL